GAVTAERDAQKARHLIAMRIAAQFVVPKNCESVKCLRSSGKVARLPMRSRQLIGGNHDLAEEVIAPWPSRDGRIFQHSESPFQRFARSAEIAGFTAVNARESVGASESAAVFKGLGIGSDQLFE